MPSSRASVRPGRLFFYQVGLVLVMVVMLILPVIYLAMVAALAWAVYYFAVHCRFLVTSHAGRSAIVPHRVMFIYVMPLFLGCLLIVFHGETAVRATAREEPGRWRLNPGG